jgi:nucleoside 2-deoxyribosyltransferase
MKTNVVFGNVNSMDELMEALQSQMGGLQEQGKEDTPAYETVTERMNRVAQERENALASVTNEDLKPKHKAQGGKINISAPLKEVKANRGNVVVYFASGWFDETQMADMMAAKHYLKQNPMLSENSFFPYDNQGTEEELDTLPWAHNQYKMDIEHMKQADVFVVNISEGSQDIGTAVEQGWAIAMGKPIIFVSNGAKGINLMNAMGNTYSTTDPSELATINLENIPANFWKGSFI